MSLETPVHNLVQQLKRAGLRPTEQLVERIQAYDSAARDALLRLATDKTSLREPAPVCWGPVHALRLLGEMPDPTIITPLLDTVPVEVYTRGDAAEYWASEVLEIIATCGAAAIPVIWSYADDTSHTERSRGAAVQALVLVVVHATEARESVVVETRTRLATCDDPLMGAFLVNTLAQLGVAEAYQEVMVAYREGRVDTEVMPAATARQLLLSGKADMSLHHTFWERYTIDGPFAEERGQHGHG